MTCRYLFLFKIGGREKAGQTRFRCPIFHSVHEISSRQKTSRKPFTKSKIIKITIIIIQCMKSFFGLALKYKSASKFFSFAESKISPIQMIPNMIFQHPFNHSSISSLLLLSYLIFILYRNIWTGVSEVSIYIIVQPHGISKLCQIGFKRQQQQW